MISCLYNGLSSIQAIFFFQLRVVLVCIPRATFYYGICATNTQCIHYCTPKIDVVYIYLSAIYILCRLNVVYNIAVYCVFYVCQVIKTIRLICPDYLNWHNLHINIMGMCPIYTPFPSTFIHVYYGRKEKVILCRWHSGFMFDNFSFCHKHFSFKSYQREGKKLGRIQRV